MTYSMVLYSTFLILKYLNIEYPAIVAKQDAASALPIISGAVSLLNEPAPTAEHLYSV